MHIISYHPDLFGMVDGRPLVDRDSVHAQAALVLRPYIDVLISNGAYALVPRYTCLLPPAQLIEVYAAFLQGTHTLLASAVPVLAICDAW